MNSETFKTIQIRFYEELNDFLPFERRKIEFVYSFDGNKTIKNVIEMIGVPHTEVDLILVNGKSAAFNYRPRNNDRVSVFPVFEAFDITSLNRLRPIPLREIKFVLDVHLGKLAKYLRMLGFDTMFCTALDDHEIVEISLHEQRIVLTRDKGLLKDKNLTHGYWVRNITPEKQLQEIISKCDLATKINSFTRCMECNGQLQLIAKDEVKQDLPENVGQYYQKFSRCLSCRKIYWEGTHYQKMQAFIRRILKAIEI